MKEAEGGFTNAHYKIIQVELENKIETLTKENKRLKRENERLIYSLHHEFRAIWATLKGLYLVDENIGNRPMWATTFDRAERFLNDMAKEYVIVKISRKFKKI